jgi:cytochrome bd-type quinol oxidase subunit 1
MDPLGQTLGLLFAIGLITLAAYVAYRQSVLLRSMDGSAPADLRRYLVSQCWRRLFGSIVLIGLAAMLAGSVFLDYNPLGMSAPDAEQEEIDAAKPAVRFLLFYLMTMFLLLMLILTLAVFDFWATARHGVRQQKKLFEEHQELLAAELESYRQRRRAELN